jgi:hypothetical protein
MIVLMKSVLIMGDLYDVIINGMIIEGADTELTVVEIKINQK